MLPGNATLQSWWTMTARSLWITALVGAVAVHVAMVLTYGAITEWCFCAVLSAGPTVIPPPFVMRFLELATLPSTLLPRNLPVPAQMHYGLFSWFLALLALLHGLAFAARIRVGRGIRLAARERVRAAHLLLPACILLAASMAAGAMHRRAWLAEAEQVFAATLSAAGAGRPLPPGVDFTMRERRGDEYVSVNPQGSYATVVDAHASGDHFLDQFVTPYTYGGMLWFESGARYKFSVYPEKAGWNVHLHPR
jgi:hypothetical protein